MTLSYDCFVSDFDQNKFMIKIQGHSWIACIALRGGAVEALGEISVCGAR